MHPSRHLRCPLSSAAARIAADRPVPHIVTELPGPKARAHVAYDETWTSPSLPRAYPIVPVRGRGPGRRGHRRQPLPRLRRRDRGQLDRPQPSAGRRRDQGAGRRAHPLLRVGLLPADLPGGLPAPGRAHADQGRPGPDLPRQLRGGGRRGVDQAGPLRDPPAVRRRLPRRVPRADLRCRLADRIEGEVPRRVRPAAARRLPRAVRPGRGPALVRRGPVRQARAGQRGRGDHRRADPGRGRLHRARGRVPAGPARHLRPPRHPAHRRRDPVRRRPHREDVGGRALGRRARHPAHRQGHRLGHAARRDGRPRGPPGVVGHRCARLDVRRQPGRLRRGAGDHRPARGRPHRQRRHPRGAGAGRAAAAGRAVRRARHRRPRDGPHARRRVRHGGARRGGPVGVLRARPARPRVRQELGPDVAGADRRRRPRWRRPCGSSARRSPHVAGHGPEVLAEAEAAGAPTGSRPPADPSGLRRSSR